MDDDQPMVVYWDASAILSVLFKDNHSDIALQLARSDGVHFISSLAYAEICAVIARMRRNGILSEPLVKVGLDSLEQGPWRRLSLHPDWDILEGLSKIHALRGADLWHLATAKTLKTDLPELKLITFDRKLEDASSAEGLVSSETATGRP